MALAKDTAMSLRRVAAFKWNERTQSKKRGWYYRDISYDTQGPYPSSWMRTWHNEGHFDGDIDVCYGEPGLWWKVEHLWKGPGQASFNLSKTSVAKDKKLVDAFLKHRLGS